MAAGDKNVGVGSVNVARQCIKAGLVDEIGIDLVPVLLVEGIPSTIWTRSRSNWNAPG